MIKNKLFRVLIISVVFIIIVIAVCSYFFRTSVNIVSEYEVEAVYYENMTNHQIHKDSTHFSHFSVYGEYSYVFVVKQHKVKVNYLKTNSYEHDDISIQVKNIDAQDDSSIQIDVEINGNLRKSEVFNLKDIDYIFIDVGP